LVPGDLARSATTSFRYVTKEPIVDEYKDLSVEEIVALQNEKKERFAALQSQDTFSAEEIEEAEGLVTEIKALAAEIKDREAAAQALADRAAALKDVSFSSDEPVEDEVTEEEEVEETDEEKAAREAEEAKAAEGEPKEEAASKSVATRTVARVAARVARPVVPESKKRLSIVASQDVPGFATGTSLEDIETVSKAVVNRMQGFGVPTGDGKSEDLKHSSVAQFRLDFDEDLIIDRHSDDMEVLLRAADESRLPQGSLTAAGGWCAPSETLYDFCGGETLEGILSVPEVQVKRGGIRYTRGPSYADLYTAAGFIQTEAQAIAGTTKPCFEVPCPTWQDVRLDAVGLCIKAPILTNAAYPELIQRWVSGAMVAHQHMVNASVLSRMDTASGAARVYAGIGTSAGDALDALELMGNQMRQKYRLAFNHTLEVVAPYWVKGVIRSDLSKRQGLSSSEQVTDQTINAHFANRGLRVSFVYDWQELTVTDLVYPSTYNVLMYPAGTFIKGVADVINLNAVYDAASLAVNIYTALFFEHAILVAQMCYESQKITLPVCNAGRVGAADLTCAVV
jgi:hypothetical protein